MNSPENLGKFVVVLRETGKVVTFNNKTSWNRKSDAKLVLNNWWRALVRGAAEYTESQVLEALGTNTFGANTGCSVGTSFKFKNKFYFKSSKNTLFTSRLSEARYAMVTPFEVRKIETVEIE